jgi:hypothetical protein
MFPPVYQWFTLTVKGKKFQVRLDRTCRIWAANFRDYLKMEINSVMEMEKKADGSYSLMQVS